MCFREGTVKERLNFITKNIVALDGIQFWFYLCDI
jgi:hypothetical protein